MQDIILIKQIKNGDISAFEKLIDKYNRYVATIVINILGGKFPKEDIQEVINDVFFLLWKNIDKIDIDLYPEIKQYLSAIARNESKNKLKTFNYTIPLEEAILPSLKNEIELTLERKWIIDCIYKLNIQEQIVLVKYYYQDKTIKQISNEENIPESTVKTRMRRGKEHLKKLLVKGEAE